MSQPSDSRFIQSNFQAGNLPLIVLSFRSPIPGVGLRPPSRAWLLSLSPKQTWAFISEESWTSFPKLELSFLRKHWVINKHDLYHHFIAVPGSLGKVLTTRRGEESIPGGLSSSSLTAGSAWLRALPSLFQPDFGQVIPRGAQNHLPG